ncbi:MAG: DDE-type integrase/transposase/recombinase [Planctomycetes bacterium]|nr:DDE-type integrase/transposase/recombinase [Planctomycetota bacterium]
MIRKGAIMAEAVRKNAPAPINWSDWIAVDDAAARLGAHRDSLSRRCREELEARGLAMKAQVMKGSPAQWFVRRSMDHRLHVEQADRPSHLDRFTDKQRTVIYAKLRCLELYRHMRSTRPGPVSAWVDRFAEQLTATEQVKLAESGITFSVSARTLRRWDRAYHGPEDVHKLADDRGGDQKNQGDPTAWNYFKGIFLEQRKPSKRSCWKRAGEWAEGHGVAWCSYASLIRQLDDRIPKEQQVMHRDPARWRSQFAAYIEQDTERFAAGQCWVGDHRPLDLLCRIRDHIFRPYITTWLDWRTRKIVGWAMSENPNSSTILAALRMGLLDETNMGGPLFIWMDNGRDFDCYSFHGRTKRQRLSKVRVQLDEDKTGGLLKHLGIEAHFAIAHNPQGKARQERWYATVGDHFDKTFATYTGPDPMRKPEQLKDVVKDLHKVPTFEHVRERFGEFVEGYNKDADHTIDDMVDSDRARLSPVQAMARWCQTRRVMADPSSLDLLLMQHHKPVRVGRNGITITVAGGRLRYGQFSDALRRFKGTKETVRVAYDPNDMRTISVRSMQFEFICTAQINATGGRHADPINRQHVAGMARQKSAYNRSFKYVADNREVEYLSDEERLAEHVARSNEPDQQAADPTTLKIIQTPVDGESKGHRSRKAAGAESHTNHASDADPLAWSSAYSTPQRFDADQDNDLLGGW